MDRPQAIKIGGIVYRVEFIDRLISTDDSTKLNGHILYNPCLIKVENQSDEQMQIVTTIHEILHGILSQAGIEDEQEKMIEVLGYGLFGVLRDNPDLIEWLQNHGEKPDG